MVIVIVIVIVVVTRGTLIVTIIGVAVITVMMAMLAGGATYHLASRIVCVLFVEAASLLVHYIDIAVEDGLIVVVVAGCVVVLALVLPIR